MEFPKNDSEIKAFGLLLKICKFENMEPSPYAPENEALKKVIAKLKSEYYELISQTPIDMKTELGRFFNWYKTSPFSSSGKTSDLIDVYLGQWKPTVTAVIKNICQFHSCNAEVLPGKLGCIEHNSLIVSL